MTGGGLLGLLVLLALLAIIPAKIASNKGRSFAGWYVFGLLFWILALIASLLVSDARARCPYCAEPVRSEAIVCRHCGRDISPVEVQRPEPWELGNDRYVGILEDRGERRRR